jgi:hypothetical protein
MFTIMFDQQYLYYINYKELIVARYIQYSKIMKSNDMLYQDLLVVKLFSLLASLHLVK